MNPKISLINSGHGTCGGGWHFPDVAEKLKRTKGPGRLANVLMIGFNGGVKLTQNVGYVGSEREENTRRGK